MGEKTKIEWCHHTFSPWRGCTKVSPGCAHCYAEQQAKRNPKVLGEWGPQGERVIAGEAYWKMPLKWDREAREAGERRRVFCASLADVFEDRPELIAPRQRLFQLIGQTPHLAWLLLTKRPQVAVENWPFWAGMAYGSRLKAGLPVKEFGPVLPNVWVGVSVEDQARADERIPPLLEIPATVRFLSVEPLLGPVDPTRVMMTGTGHPIWHDVLRREYGDGVDGCRLAGLRAGVDWVIIGGESGPHARPCHVGWVRNLLRQCRDARVPCFVKQLGGEPRPSALPSDVVVRFIRDPKGGDPAEWPEDLRVREFPNV